MTSPAVSIVVTAYNRADCIGRAIASVRAQSFADWNLIVVDDASTDDTAAVVAAMDEPRLTLIRNAVNRGIGGAKNVGVAAADGAFVAFLDSDDTWHPDKLRRQLAAMAATPSQPLSFTAFEVVRPNGRAVVRRPRRYGTWRRSILLGEVTSLGSTLLARRSCFEEIGPFDESLRRMQDRDWMLRYLDRHESFLCLDDPLSRIINTGWPDAATTEDAARRLLERNRERLVRWDADSYRTFRASLGFEVAVAEARAGHRRAALRRLAAAMADSPAFAVHVVRRFGRKLVSGDFS